MACSLPLRSRLKFVAISYFNHACYMPYPSHPPWFNHSNNRPIWWSKNKVIVFILLLFYRIFRNTRHSLLLNWWVIFQKMQENSCKNWHVCYNYRLITLTCKNFITVRKFILVCMTFTFLRSFDRLIFETVCAHLSIRLIYTSVSVTSFIILINDTDTSGQWLPWI